MNQMSGAVVSLSLKQLSPVVARRRPQFTHPFPQSSHTMPPRSIVLCKAGTSKSREPHKLPSQQNGKCRPQKFFPQNLGQLKLKLNLKRQDGAGSRLQDPGSRTEGELGERSWQAEAATAAGKIAKRKSNYLNGGSTVG